MAKAITLATQEDEAILTIRVEDSEFPNFDEAGNNKSAIVAAFLQEQLACNPDISIQLFEYFFETIQEYALNYIDPMQYGDDDCITFAEAAELTELRFAEAYGRNVNIELAPAGGFTPARAYDTTTVKFFYSNLV